MPFVLWDIDGTLVRAGDIGARVFDLAIERTFGAPPPAGTRIHMSGKTDPQIVLEYLELADLRGPDAQAHLPAVLAHLEKELAAAQHLVRRHGVVLPGVATILPRLFDDDRFHQTVLTGNIAPNALVKLAAFGLERWLDLDVGAFGSDDADRRRLVPLALERLASVRGARVSPEETWVVGDSVNDLRCARAGGVRCLLVATGRTSYDELAALDPDALRADLGDVDEIVDLLAS